MMAKKQKFYVVWSGREPGVYGTWAECERQVKGFKGARYKSFDNEKTAKEEFENEGKVTLDKNSDKPYIEESISTDAACSGNPGVLEYQGVNTKDGKQLFHAGPFPVGTNNLGEFLGIVEAIHYLIREKKPNMPIYTDSQTAITWIKNKRVKSNLVRDDSTAKLWKKIDEAVKWLENNEFTNPILKWETEKWGEIKADFGRKSK